MAIKTLTRFSTGCSLGVLHYLLALPFHFHNAPRCIYFLKKQDPHHPTGVFLNDQSVEFFQLIIQQQLNLSYIKSTSFNLQKPANRAISSFFCSDYQFIQILIPSQLSLSFSISIHNLGTESSYQLPQVNNRYCVKSIHLKTFKEKIFL